MKKVLAGAIYLELLSILVSWCSVSINVNLYYERPATQGPHPQVM